MNRRVTTTLVLLLLAAVPPVFAQSPEPNVTPRASAVAPSQEAANPSVRANRDAAMDADARHCLEFPDNLQIVLCAEKYLPHKRGV